MVSSKSLGPFRFETVPVVLPIDKNGEWLPNSRLREKYWTEISDMYHDKHPSEPSELTGQIDYQRKLTSQFSVSPPLLIHNTSGNAMYAAVSRERAICDSGTYYVPCSSVTEALFLASLLNAPVLQDAYRYTKNSSRHFHKSVWEKIPIPRFDKKDKAHRRLANLGARAEDAVNKSTVENMGQREMRQALCGTLEETGILSAIDAEAKRVLPDYV